MMFASARLFPCALIVVTALAACAPAAPTDAASPAALEQAPPLDLPALERAVHRRVNAERTARGLRALAWNDALHPLARAHSRDMVRRDFFAHVNPDGQDAAARADAAELTCVKTLGKGRTAEGMGENLLATSRLAAIRDTYARRSDAPRGESEHVARRYEWKTLEEIAEETVSGWMQSAPHRANLLDPLYETHALGIALAENGQDAGRLFITQNLC